MIEILIPERCVDCDLCVVVCPMNVFDRVPESIPVIARQADCQTCYLCEAYCPTDALYVAPLSKPVPEHSIHRDVETLVARGILGSYRARLGWGKGRKPPRNIDEVLGLAGGPPEDADWQRMLGEDELSSLSGASLLHLPAEFAQDGTGA